ncbi:hypothetical protein Efla_007266 [Eimeria flavescens]
MYVSLFGGPPTEQAAGGPSVGGPSGGGPQNGAPSSCGGPLKPAGLANGSGFSQPPKGPTVNAPMASPFGAAPPQAVCRDVQQQQQLQQQPQQQPMWGAPVAPPPRLSFLQ